MMMERMVDLILGQFFCCSIAVQIVVIIYGSVVYVVCFKLE